MIIQKQLNLWRNTSSAPQRKGKKKFSGGFHRLTKVLIRNSPHIHTHERIPTPSLSLSNRQLYWYTCVRRPPHQSDALSLTTWAEGYMYAEAICLVFMAYSLLNFPRIVNSTLALNSYAYECFSLWEDFSFHNTLVWEAALHVKSRHFCFCVYVCFFSLFHSL